MMRRIKIGVLVAVVSLIALTGSANAVIQYVPGASLVVTPQNFTLQPGQVKTLVATYYTPVGTSVSPGTDIMTYAINIPVNLTVTSVYYYDSATSTNISVSYTPIPATYGGSGSVAWIGPAGTYYITMRVGASPTATPAKGNITFSVTSNNNSATTGTAYYSAIPNITTNLSITPEFLTLALAGVGAAAIVLLRRRGF